MVVTTTTTTPAVPLGWVAPSGVQLAVTSVNDGSVTVLTPCGDEVDLSEGRPVTAVDVVLDPGHGGPVDTGAVGSNGLAEKEINLQVALRAGELLESQGVGVLLTRTGDYPIPIPVRSQYADLTGAKALVSIHHNAPVAPASTIPGVEIFVQRDSGESQRLGGLLYEAAMDGLAMFDVDWDRAPDAGVMTVTNPEGEDAYGMVRLPETPSALLELGYIANPSEAALYRDPAYVEAAAGAISDAIVAFLTSDAPGAGLVDGRTFDPQPGVGFDKCVEPELDQPLYPDVLSVDVEQEGRFFDFAATISSPYDSPDRYADAFRVIADDGAILGVRELTHDHAAEQPFTRSLLGVEIPDDVTEVTIQGRDSVYGWGGGAVIVELP